MRKWVRKKLKYSFCFDMAHFTPLWRLSHFTSSACKFTQIFALRALGVHAQNNHPWMASLCNFAISHTDGNSIQVCHHYPIRGEFLSSDTRLQRHNRYLLGFYLLVPEFNVFSKFGSNAKRMWQFGTLYLVLMEMVDFFKMSLIWCI